MLCSSCPVLSRCVDVYVMLSWLDVFLKYTARIVCFDEGNPLLSLVLAQLLGLKLTEFRCSLQLGFSSKFGNSIINDNEIVNREPLFKVLSSSAIFVLCYWRCQCHECNMLSVMKRKTLLTSFGMQASNRPHGTDGLPTGIIVAETDLYQRRLWGDPAQVASDFSHPYFV